MAVWAMVLAGSAATAHETPVALLKLTEIQAGRFNANWTYSSATNVFPPNPVFPSHCEYDYPGLNCGETSLYGQFKIEKLGERYSAAVVQIKRLDDSTDTYTLTGSTPSIMLAKGGKLPIGVLASSYIPLGFEHIMLGIDHLLFVFGLMLLTGSLWMLVKTITSFTIAHSITLTAVTLGWIGVPEAPVNATIALSIVFVAIEVLKHQRRQPCFSARYPWLIAFGFGLLHGFGFAGALTDIGLSPENLPMVLLFFNVGVEIGQIAFVLLVLALVRSHKILEAGWPEWAKPVGMYAMGSVAGFWFISRLTAIVYAQ